MTPKKAIVIILILLLAILIIFSILYFNKEQEVAPSDEANINQTEQTNEIEKNEAAKPSEVIEDKVNQIIEESKQNPTADPDTVRQEIITTINNEIIKQEQSKTPEEKAADLKAQEERQKIIDQINSQIKEDSLNN